jgi:hypothetical protein
MSTVRIGGLAAGNAAPIARTTRGAARVLCVLALAAGTSMPAADTRAQDKPDAMLRTYLDGRAALAQAVRAHGGAERLARFNTLRFWLEGQIVTAIQLQGYAPPDAAPQGEPAWVALDTWLDLVNGRFRATGHQTAGGGFVFRFETVYAKGTLANVQPFPRLVTRTQVADADAAREQALSGLIRMVPAVMLKSAVARLGSVRSEGDDTFEGRAVRRLGFNLDGNARVALLVDTADGTVRATEQVATDPVAGVTTVRYAYHDWHTVDGIPLPRRVTAFRRGLQVFDLRIQVARDGVDAPFADADFAVDAALKEQAAAQIDVAQPKPGLWEVSGAGNGNYRIQFVELADRVVAYEAPLSPSVVRQMIAKFREKVPAKPISHVVLSHFHADHAGGVRAFADLGATIVTTADSVDVVRRIASAQPRLAVVEDLGAPQLRFATVTRSLELGDAARPLTAIELTNSPHVARLLVLADRRNKAVFNGDLYSENTPYNATFDAFAEWLGGQPELELVLGTHHAPVPVKALLEGQAQFRKK